MVKGSAAASGIAVGKAFVLPDWEWDVPENVIDVSDLAFEFEKLHEGIRLSKTEIEAIKNDIADVLGVKESNIFDAHLAILEDPVFMNEVAAIMQRQYKAAEVAVKEVVDKFVNMFDLLDDEYMKERALDIKDVGTRLMKHLLGTMEPSQPPADQPYILVAKELTPSQFAHLDPAQLLGIVTTLGGTTSHTAIMARAMGIPFVFGFDTTVQTGELLIIDGDEGDVLIQPDEPTVEHYLEKKRTWLERRQKLQQIIGLPPITQDGRAVRLGANISTFKDLELALSYGASGVGLFRTEFLYMDRSSLPKEDEQFEVYRQVTEKLGGKSLIIRTLDIGGDKLLDYLPLPEEDNPALGYRAIRILLDRRDLFKTQLKAILRAGVYGDVKILYPMISSVEELRRAGEVLEQAKRELRELGAEFREQVDVGIMIEVPAAAVIADLLAQEVQFFSIGTNDLVQYVLTVDRMNEHIAHLYNPYHPAIIRMLKHTVEAAQRHGIPVGVCGELAGDVNALPIWLGLGVHDLSMSAHSILPVKNRLLESSEAVCRDQFERVLACRTSEEIRAVLGF
ncbi:phosphoenolpyruvate--protein phosphotransferase [Paenibacillus koleovorans]|uniref:phosphoenolpyruvate--protein phosphotransferase n=1 Tax=Paenibacillus koleovorans TaxID=121608 RepID=UPI000FDAE509|nr:phosphoenolpyruvate--protein phosphotransferase [Paenibacillus koleovorans]